MGKTIDPQELRDNYLGMSVHVVGGRGLSQGRRFVYLRACDGRKARVFDSLGRPYVLPLDNFKLLSTHDIEGNVVPHRVNADNGQLEVCIEGCGWREICPWRPR